MKHPRLTGLGEPETTGKHSLFQPPTSEPVSLITAIAKIPETQEKENKQSTTAHVRKRALRRVHITTELTVDALRVIQSIQDDYRLKYGKVLPQWKAFSQVIERYGQSIGKEYARELPIGHQ